MILTEKQRKIIFLIDKHGSLQFNEIRFKYFEKEKGNQSIKYLRNRNNQMEKWLKSLSDEELIRVNKKGARTYNVTAKAKELMHYE